MEGAISERLLDQRLRNRVMESLLWLAEGIGHWGAHEYFDQFYDQMNMENRPWPNSTMTSEELAALEAICDLMNAACKATPKNLTDEDMRTSGWLERIQPEARRVLSIFLERGRCDEEVEQDEPSEAEGQAWYNLADQKP